MRYLAIMLILLVTAVAAGVWLYGVPPDSSPVPPAYRDTALNEGVEGDTNTDVSVIATNLSVPWELLFLPDGEMLVTERAGRIVLLRQGVVVDVPGVVHRGEGGLLGAALDPDFSRTRHLYLYETRTDDDGGLSNRIVRYSLVDAVLTVDRVLVDGLPGARYHDGGRLMFGPDGYLYATVGDALRPEAAEDPRRIEGSIIRITRDGEPAPDNPFDSMVYSYGHRNSQGLTWDDAGRLWSSEHGRSGLRSGFDEINRILSGGNYGWPQSEGDTVAAGTMAPVRHSTATTTWAPGDLLYHSGNLYMPGLRGQRLYVARTEGDTIVDWEEHLVGTYGRLRTIRLGPDGYFYVLTSNRDGRGEPVFEDDRILRVHPSYLRR